MTVENFSSQNQFVLPKACDRVYHAGQVLAGFVFRQGSRSTDVATHDGIFVHAKSCPDLVTSDRFRGADLKAEFPALHSRDFRAPRLEGDIMSIPALGLSMRIPLPVFHLFMPEMV